MHTNTATHTQQMTQVACTLDRLPAYFGIRDIATQCCTAVIVLAHKHSCMPSGAAKCRNAAIDLQMCNYTRICALLLYWCNSACI